MAKQPQRQSYRYTGPVTPLEHDGAKPRMLFPGTAYSDLPLEQDNVQNMIETGLLIAETSDGEPVGEPVASVEPLEGA